MTDLGGEGWGSVSDEIELPDDIMNTGSITVPYLSQAKLSILLFPAAVCLAIIFSHSVADVLALTHTGKLIADALLVIFLIWFWRRKEDVLYAGVRGFFNVVLNIFFKHIDRVGLDRVPKTATIIVGNHQNQFIDGLMMIVSSPRDVAPLMAEVSLKRPFIGHFASLLGAIPVRRPQDYAKKGVGTVSVSGEKVVGSGTEFDKICKAGDTLVVGKLKGKVAKVTSPTEIVLQAALSPDPIALSPYVIHPHLDHSEMFSAVYDKLGSGGCIGIFPEGGSHDRSDLLALKPGVAIMALGTLERYPDLELYVEPCGFNYFGKGHRFRSRCVVDYGAPLRVTKEMLAEYQKDKRAAVASLLKKIEERLRSVTITVPDYQSLSFVHTFRSLYQPTDYKLTSEEYMELTHRFSVAYKATKDRPEVKKLEGALAEFRKLNKRHGLNPHQPPTRSLYGLRTLPSALYVLLLALVAAVPVIFNLPVGLTARYLSHREQKKALKKSSVKVAARDVVGSYKLLVALILIPVWYAVLATLVFVFSPYRVTYNILAVMLFPLASYMGVRFTEEGLLGLNRSLKPMFMRLLPSARAEQEKIKIMRRELQAAVRQMVEDLGSQVAETKEFMKDRVISVAAMRKRATSVGEFVPEEHPLA